MRLSKNFTLDELTKSQTAYRLGINNMPNSIEIENLRLLCENVLQPIRDHFKRPVVINSGFRSLPVNRSIGSSDNSQHVKGQAADIEIMSISTYTLAVWISRNLNYDQLILEMYDPHSGDPNSGWVHVSYNGNGRNRKQDLTYLRSGSYVPGLVK